MLGIVPGQILSIGYEGVDIEHFTVKSLGSVISATPFAKSHPALSPVRLVRNSFGSTIADADAGNVPSVGGAPRRTRKSADNSDVESEIDSRVVHVTNRKIQFPMPYPVAHKDLAK